MKAFIAACLILLSLIGAITANGIVMHHRLNGIIDAVLMLPDELPQESRIESSVEALLFDRWEGTKPLATFTVSAARIENVERALRTLRAGWDARDDALYRQARADLLLWLTQIRAAEWFSTESIL